MVILSFVRRPKMYFMTIFVVFCILDAHLRLYFKHIPNICQRIIQFLLIFVGGLLEFLLIFGLVLIILGKF